MTIRGRKAIIAQAAPMPISNRKMGKIDFQPVFCHHQTPPPKARYRSIRLAEQLPLHGQVRALSIQGAAVTIQQSQDFNQALLIGSHRQFSAGFGLFHGFLESLFLRS